MAGTFTGPIQTKAIKNFGEKEAWAYPGTAQIFWVPLLSQERVKLRTSNFVGTFIGSIGTKDDENVGNSSRGHSQGVLKIEGTRIYGASRGHLFDNTAFL